MKLRQFLKEQTLQSGKTSKDGLNDHEHDVHINEFGDGYTSFDEKHSHVIVKGYVKTANGHIHKLIKGDL